MKKGPVFLGVYSKTLPIGDAGPEGQRRWHAWSLDAGQFLIQEIFPETNEEGKSERIDSSEFFASYRVHASFSASGKAQSPKMPTEQPTNAAPKEKKQAATASPPPSKSIFDELDEDDGLSDNIGQAKAPLDEDLYPMRKIKFQEEETKSATFYTSKTVSHKPSRPFITDIEKVEEQLRSDFSLALIRLQTNREKALETLNKIIDNDTKFETKHKFMFSDFGTALRRRRLYAMSFRFHERAKELAPDDEHILFNMARAMFDAGKIDQARKYLQQAVAMASDFQAGSDFLEFIEGKYSHRL